MATSSTQIAVIGAGPGGYAAAFYAADLGFQAALIDADVDPGGVCLYRGCIPSKALLHAAKVLGESKHATAWGIEFAAPKINLDQLRGWKNRVVSKLTGGLGQVARFRKVRYIQGRASFVDARTLSIGQENLTFDHAIIATGSRPSMPPGFPTSTRVMDSTGALDLPDIPKRLLVVGGGYIGLELGSVYAALGSEVTVVEMMPGLLPGADRDLVAVLAKRMEGVLRAVLLETKVASIVEEGAIVRVTLEGKNGKSVAEFDRVLVSVGRRPNSEVPGLDRTRVKVNQRGFIDVDPARRTAEPSIFAIGDVVGEPMLAHKASHEARVAVDAIAGKNAAFEPQAIPAVVFTDPEIAWCGLTETEAERRGQTVEVAKFPWAALGRAMTLDRPEGFTKLLIDPATERVLGVGIVGAGAGELIAEGVVAIEMGATAADLAMSIHPHPTLPETIMEAAEVFFGHSTHVYKPKRK
ncbi:MAG TPA: dihydrolipoyl dehydrogenase [Vicinamibacterales bacterium]|jgi:dihydrolipoamide dehydrogenase|nr:dihydrolipoyl dehydrogenase [Vicinamibacterales bacterium]